MRRWSVVCQVLYNSVCRLLILAVSHHTFRPPSPVLISVIGADVYNIFFFVVQKFWVVDGVGDLIYWKQHYMGLILRLYVLIFGNLGRDRMCATNLIRVLSCVPVNLDDILLLRSIMF